MGLGPLPLGVSATLVSVSLWAGPAVSILLSGGVGTHPPFLTFRLWINSPVMSDSVTRLLLLFAGPPFCECSPIAGGVRGMRATTALAGRKPCFLLSFSLSLSLTHTLACARLACIVVESHPYSNDISIDTFVCSVILQ